MEGAAKTEAPTGPIVNWKELARQSSTVAKLGADRFFVHFADQIGGKLEHVNGRLVAGGMAIGAALGVGKTWEHCREAEDAFAGGLLLGTLGAFGGLGLGCYWAVASGPVALGAISYVGWKVFAPKPRALNLSQ